MLPNAWVDRIHTRLLVRYGNEWISKWAGIPEEAVKADWANELAGVRAESIAYALDHLPRDRAPNAAQFHELCRCRPEPAALALPDYTRADPEVVKAVTGAVKRAAGNDPKAWARRLKARIDAGYKPTITQRNMVRDALENRCEVIEA